MIRLSVLAFAVLLGLSGPAVAMGSGSGGDTGAPRTPAKAADPNYAAGKSAIDAGNWQGAIDALTRAVAADASNADAFNYLGYANRKLGKYPDAFTHYQKALALNPEHKGAHEYIGEAYLETGNLAKAEEHLKALDKICLFSCKEYTELKARVAEFKSKKAS
jgi:tetratricopeptide (TPR) repeat protein